VGLTDSYGVAYVSDIYMGNNSVTESMIFDTGSGWVTVPLYNCTDCHNTGYDPSNSSNGEWVSSNPS
jgi:hypothetical protein